VLLWVAARAENTARRAAKITTLQCINYSQHFLCRISCFQRSWSCGERGVYARCRCGKLLAPAPSLTDWQCITRSQSMLWVTPTMGNPPLLQAWRGTRAGLGTQYSSYWQEYNTLFYYQSIINCKFLSHWYDYDLSEPCSRGSWENMR
jgi:hypothetical protein